MIAFMKHQTIENVVLNNDVSDELPLGGISWSLLSVKVKTAFLRKIKVMIIQNKQTANKLGSVIANRINLQLIWSSVGAEIQQKKAAATTKPPCTNQMELYFKGSIQ